MSASWQLQAALMTALIGDATLTGLLGSARIYDMPPFRVRLPYITLGMSQTRDWSTSTETGAEHLVTFHSWTEIKNREKALAIEEAIKVIIETTSLTMADHVLVNAFYQFSEVRRDTEGDAFHGIIRYRMVTEPN